MIFVYLWAPFILIAMTLGIALASGRVPSEILEEYGIHSERVWAWPLFIGFCGPLTILFSAVRRTERLFDDYLRNKSPVFLPSKSRVPPEFVRFFETVTAEQLRIVLLHLSDKQREESFYLCSSIVDSMNDEERQRLMVMLKSGEVEQG